VRSLAPGGRWGARLLPALVAGVVLVGSDGATPWRDGDTDAVALHVAAPARPGFDPADAIASREAGLTAASRSQARASTGVARVGTGVVSASAPLTVRTWDAAAGAASRARVGMRRAGTLASFTPPVRGRITSGYGPRWGRMHHGMDFGAPYGAPLRAVGAGTVTETAYNSGLGHHVRLTLEDGTEVTYGHLSRVTVTPGQRVSPGARLGSVGSSGTSTGAHLHLEVRTPHGKRIDPRPWLAEREILS
jgi:murein DD-endopeptidase MepM/ murein hydrolase activator NlpD